MNIVLITVSALLAITFIFTMIFIVKHKISLTKLEDKNELINELRQEKEKLTLENDALKSAYQKIEHIKEQREEDIKNIDIYSTKIGKDLLQEFQKVINMSTESQNEIKDFKSSLLFSLGAGKFAEITLENLLEFSGLIKDIDFKIQPHITTSSDQKNLKPDVIVNLPNNNKIIIDSKSSKYFGPNNKNEDQKTIDKKLKETINNQIKDLQSKDYKKNYESLLIREGQDTSNSIIQVIMFIPSDLAINRLLEIIPDLYEKCHNNDIIPCGPSGLLNILYYAKFQIIKTKQIENHEKIIDEVKELLNNVATLSNHAIDLGKSVKQANNYYGKFESTLNRSILTRKKNLFNLGIESKPTQSIINDEDK